MTADALGRRESVTATVEDWQSFPTLQEALSRVNPHVGFNIEVKYPMQYTVGTYYSIC